MACSCSHMPLLHCACMRQKNWIVFVFLQSQWSVNDNWIHEWEEAILPKLILWPKPYTYYEPQWLGLKDPENSNNHKDGFQVVSGDTLLPEMPTTKSVSLLGRWVLSSWPDLDPMWCVWAAGRQNSSHFSIPTHDRILLISPLLHTTFSFIWLMGSWHVFHYLMSK